MATAVLGNLGDMDTLVLKEIWKNIPEISVYDITKKTPSARKSVCRAIEEEKDLLIFAGHGQGNGLFNTSSPFLWDSTEDMMLLDHFNRDLIRADKVIGIWCYASDFARTEKLNGFFSSMFISNPIEASFCGIEESVGKKITADEIKFCRDLNYLIKSDIPMSLWKENLISKADMSDPVVKFNYDGLYYKG